MSSTITGAVAAAAASAQGLSVPVDSKATLKLKGGGFTELVTLGALAPSLRKLDLSGNHLTRLPADVLPPRITFLNASGNKLTGVALSASDAGSASQLVVFNASHCAIASLPSTTMQKCSVLKALVLNNNALKGDLDHLQHLTTLNTLVLSHNRLPRVPKTLLAKLPGLVKLSLSHNRLTSFPKVWLCPALVELRLAGNAITEVPSKAGRLTCLRLLDLSANAIPDFDSVAALAPCPRLANVSFKGNPVAGEVDGVPSSKYQAQVRSLLPHLALLDGNRLVGNARGRRGQAAPGAAIALKRRRQGLTVDDGMLAERAPKAPRTGDGSAPAPAPPAAQAPAPALISAPEPIVEAPAPAPAPAPLRLKPVDIAPGDMPSVSGALGVEAVSERKRKRAAKKAARAAASVAAPPVAVGGGGGGLGAAGW